MYIKIGKEKFDNLELVINQYSCDDSIYLGLYNTTDGAIADITVNVDTHMFLKDYLYVAINHDSEFTILDFIKRYQIAQETDFFIPSGYVDFTVVKLNPDKIIELCSDKEKACSIFKKLDISFNDVLNNSKGND